MITNDDGTPLAEILMKREASILRKVLYSLNLNELLGLSHWFGMGGRKESCIEYKSMGYISIRESLNIILKNHPDLFVQSLDWEKAPTRLVDTYNEISIEKSYGKYDFKPRRICVRVRSLLAFELTGEETDYSYLIRDFLL